MCNKRQVFQRISVVIMALLVGLAQSGAAVPEQIVGDRSETVPSQVTTPSTDTVTQSNALGQSDSFSQSDSLVKHAVTSEASQPDVVGTASVGTTEPRTDSSVTRATQAPAAIINTPIPVWTEPKYIAANKKLMDGLYVGISGFARRITPEEQEFIKGTYTKKTYVYGEILYDSLQTILDNEHFGPNDVFYDLGSGMGKVVTQVYLNTPVKKAVGVELSHTRHAGAMEMFKELKQTDAYKERLRNGKTRRVMAFQEKDFLKANIDDATIIYMCSTCFPPELLEKLLEKFEKINRLGLRIITLKELPDYQKYGFRFERRYDLPMTWSKPGNTSKVYVYSYAGNIFN